MTSLTTNQKTIQDIYGTYLGRQAATEGLDYWGGQLDAGKSVADVIRGIQSGSEYKNRANYLKANPTATEAELDANITPGGGSYYKDKKLTAIKFDPNNTWAKHHLTTGNNEFTDELAAINKELGITGMGIFSDKVEGTDTLAAENTGNFNVGVTHDAAGNPITSTGTGTGTGTETGTGTGTGTGTETGTGTGSNYLTAADLTSWWDKLDKPWLTQADDTAATANTGGDDDFMKMMMFMAMMRPQGGGGGFGQYGYGGLNPGGVQSAYNPMANLSSYMDAFKTLPGLSSSTISTGSN